MVLFPGMRCLVLTTDRRAGAAVAACGIRVRPRSSLGEECVRLAPLCPAIALLCRPLSPRDIHTSSVPGEIIRHAVWRYCRFPRSHCDVEELRLVRGVMVFYEAIRKWYCTCGQPYAKQPDIGARGLRIRGTSMRSASPSTKGGTLSGGRWITRAPCAICWGQIVGTSKRPSKSSARSSRAGRTCYVCSSPIHSKVMGLPSGRSCLAWSTVRAALSIIEARMRLGRHVSESIVCSGFSQRVMPSAPCLRTVLSPTTFRPRRELLSAAEYHQERRQRLERWAEMTDTEWAADGGARANGLSVRPQRVSAPTR
jgi:hypothetical protein